MRTSYKRILLKLSGESLMVVSNTQIQTMVEVGNILTLFQNKTHAKRATITLMEYTLIFAISFANGKMSRGLNLVDC